MRILHVVLTPRHSGAEILVRDLARIHVSEGHSVGVCALNPAEEAFRGEVERSIADGVKWFLPKQPLRKFERVRAIRRACHQLKAEVVVAHAVIPSIWTRIALWASRVPIISVLHDASEDDFASLPFRIMETILRVRNSAVVAVSEKALENYKRRFGQDDKTNVIKNGVDLSRYREREEERENLRKRYNLHSEDILLVQIGRIMKTKGQLTSLQSSIKVLNGNPRVKLWFAGLTQERDYYDSIQEVISEHSLTDQVKILGPRDDIPELLAASDIFLMPSMQEAHSVALLEGLSSGSICIISDIKVFDFARSLVGVYLVPVGDVEHMYRVIELCISNKSRYKREIERWSIRKTAKSYIDIMERS